MRTKPLIHLTQEEKVEFYIEKRMSYSFYTADFWEIIMPIAGTAEISADGNKRTIMRGVMAFFAPQVKRRITLKGGNGEYLSIRLKDEVIKSVLTTFDDESYKAFSSLDCYVLNVDDEHVKSVLGAVEDIHIAPDKDKPTLLKKLCYSVFILLVPFRYYNEGKDVTQKALAVMNDPRYVAYRLPDVADKIGVSEEYLVRCFKKNGLETPNTIFKKIKMRYAKSVLTSQKISVSDVAQLIGFRSVGHFNKLYYSEFGVCPGVDKSKT